MSDRRHLFVSHHHADDHSVDQFVKLLGKRALDVRNSSIRAKPSNAERLKNSNVTEKVIRRLLRMKISWASSVVVLIGKKTHTRPWVDWEIEEANAQGKRIIGVYEHGGRENDISPTLEKYATSIVAWNAGNIQEAIDGNTTFENADGSPRTPATGLPRSVC